MHYSDRRFQKKGFFVSADLRLTRSTLQKILDFFVQSRIYLLGSTCLRWLVACGNFVGSRSMLSNRVFADLILFLGVFIIFGQIYQRSRAERVRICARRSCFWIWYAEINTRTMSMFKLMVISILRKAFVACMECVVRSQYQPAHNIVHDWSPEATLLASCAVQARNRATFSAWKLKV